MLVFCATCAVRVPGALGRGGLAACKARAEQQCSCVDMVQRMTFGAHNVVRVQNKTTPAMSEGRGGVRGGAEIAADGWGAHKISPGNINSDPNNRPPASLDPQQGGRWWGKQCR